MSNEITYDALKGYLNLSLKIATAKLPVGTLVEITADDTVDSVGASSAVAIGEVQVTVDTVNKLGTIATFFRRVFDVVLHGTVAAGDLVEVKSTTGSGATLAQKFGKVTGTIELAPGRGIALQGGNADDEVEVGFF